jgi:hypothetical protein
MFQRITMVAKMGVVVVSLPDAAELDACWLLLELLQERSCTGQGGRPAVGVFLQEGVGLI